MTEIIIMIYLGVGAIVNMFLHVKDSAKISAMMMSGYGGVMLVMLTGILNHFIWPYSLYLYFIKK